MAAFLKSSMNSMSSSSPPRGRARRDREAAPVLGERAFFQAFFTWYNIAHRRSGIGPDVVHYGRDLLLNK